MLNTRPAVYGDAGGVRQCRSNVELWFKWKGMNEMRRIGEADRIVIIGGGISGLSSAFYLLREAERQGNAIAYYACR